ncbi:MAG: MBL fold metallo-hydrolase [Phycisphaerae bacterium]
MKRNHLPLWTALAGLLIAGGSALAQRNYDNVKIKTTHVAGNVYMLEGSGGHIGVSAGEDGLLIVDDEFAPLADKIRTALAGLSKGKLAFVLNTHWHGDHTGGNPKFGREATIIANTNVRKRLATRQTMGGRKTGPLPKEGLPVITFDESLSIHFNGEEIRALHFPHGHTDGDTVVWFTGSNVVHMGDDLFNEMFPFVDLDHGGDVLGLIRNVKAVIDQLPPDVKVIPGHGPLTDLSGLKTFHRMLVETTDVVKSALAAGKTLDQIKAAGVPDRWKKWGGGFIKTDRWLETIHRSLAAPKKS